MARSHQERNEQIIYDYKTLKLSYKQLSEKYALNTVTIYDIIHSRQKPKSYEDKQRKRQTRDQSIVHDYTQFHLSLNQIAEKYELSPNRVRDIIREHGISTSERPLISAEIKAMIISDYNETDMTLSDIVEKYGVTEPTIIKFIKISKNPLRKTRTAESRCQRPGILSSRSERILSVRDKVKCQGRKRETDTTGRKCQFQKKRAEAPGKNPRGAQVASQRSPILHRGQKPVN